MRYENPMGRMFLVLSACCFLGNAALGQTSTEPAHADQLQQAVLDKAEAQMQLCLAYFSGDQGERNLEKAYFWCHRAIYRITQQKQDSATPMAKAVLNTIEQLERDLTIQQKHRIAKQLLEWQPGRLPPVK